MSRQITILDSNYIRAFGMNGPITSPISCEDSTIKQLIDAGHKVYEKFADGTSKRLTRADFEIVTANQIKPAATPKPAAVTTTKIETSEKIETPVVEEGKVFNGVSATTTASIPEKEESEPDTASLTKSQRRAQKKAKLEAAKEAENTTEE